MGQNTPAREKAHMVKQVRCLSIWDWDGGCCAFN